MERFWSLCIMLLTWATLHRWSWNLNTVRYSSTHYDDLHSINRWQALWRAVPSNLEGVRLNVRIINEVLTKLRRNTLVTVRILRFCVSVTMTKIFPITERMKMIEYSGIITSAPNPLLPAAEEEPGTELMVENMSAQVLTTSLPLDSVVETSATKLMLPICRSVISLISSFVEQFAEFGDMWGQDTFASKRWSCASSDIVALISVVRR